MEQKKFVFMYRTDFRDEPARPDPTMTLFDSLFLNSVRDMNLKLLHNIVIGLGIIKDISIKFYYNISKTSDYVM